jgi:hypothetical protein
VRSRCAEEETAARNREVKGCSVSFAHVDAPLTRAAVLEHECASVFGGEDADRVG